MSLRDELRTMAEGFRWGRRPMVPRSAEAHTPPREDPIFPTDWARTGAGTAARLVILNVGLGPLLRSQVALRVYGLEHLRTIDGGVIFFSNHSSHLDATIIMTALPERWQERTAVGAARDYFFDVWWRAAFTALTYGAFPIDRSRGARNAVTKARELLDDGWRLCIEAGVGAVPIGIRGAYQAMPKGRWWPRAGRPPVRVRIGAPLFPEEGETHQAFTARMTQAVAELLDEDRTTWWEALQRAERGETPPPYGPTGPEWLKRWEGTRPIERRGSGKTWE
jgi:1-acyl-sn-glycerol-3-phosphate acyltransferase